MTTYGLIGRSLKHSFSQRYFTEKFRCEKIEAIYLNFELADIRDVRTVVSGYPGLKGFNVTIPYKQEIIPFLDALSDEARQIGAVNCVKVSRTADGNLLTGYNTDVFGFKESLCRFIPETITKALILGNGGAAKAVRYVLDSLHIGTLTVSRTPYSVTEIGYPEVGVYLPEHKLIVNTTPLGTWPDTSQSPDIPYALLTPEHYLFDLVYNPDITTFMQRGATFGTHVRNGIEMLTGQAEKAWEIWNITADNE